MYFLILLLAVASSQALDCTITSIDDIDLVLERCQNITVGDLEVPDGSVLEFKLNQNSTLNFDGHVKFGVTYQNRSSLLKITGTGIEIIGNSGHVLDGQGDKYWDRQDSDDDKRKPILLEIQGEDLTIQSLNILNCPQTCVKVFKSKNIIIKDTNIDISIYEYDDFGIDTHGIAISNSSDVIVRSANISNQGDCVVVQQGADIVFEEITCAGSQGLTVRPEWELTNYIVDVVFKNCTVIYGLTGIRVVTSPHEANGLISNVSYTDIQVTGILFRGIDVRQDLDDEGHPSDNVEISTLNISRVYGNVINDYARSVNIWCGTNACADWTWSDIHIEKALMNNTCNCIPLGWSCW